MAGVPAVRCIRYLCGPDYHRGLGYRSVSLPAGAPFVRLSVLPFGRLYLVPLVLRDGQRAIECCRGNWCGAIGHSLVVFCFPFCFFPSPPPTTDPFLLIT